MCRVWVWSVCVPSSHRWNSNRHIPTSARVLWSSLVPRAMSFEQGNATCRPSWRCVRVSWFGHFGVCCFEANDPHMHVVVVLFFSPLTAFLSRQDRTMTTSSNTQAGPWRPRQSQVSFSMKVLVAVLLCLFAIAKHATVVMCCVCGCCFEFSIIYRYFLGVLCNIDIYR